MEILTQHRKLLSAFFAGALLLLLYLLTQNFLLFHAYAEGFTIVIASLMFVITWHARKYIDNYYLHFIGLSYLFIANIDFLHVLGYTGMNIFPDYDFYANQLWVLGRFMESLTLVGGFYFLHKGKKANDWIVLFSYTLISAVGILSIISWQIFPEAFVAGEGQTMFKMVSEFIIIGILIGVLIGLKVFRHHFSQNLYRFLQLSILATIVSELFFTFYIDNYSISNVLGHYFKIISFYLIYKSIIEKGIREPYDVIFRKLEIKRKELSQANDTKMKLFSIIGHDLKSPFHSLLGTVELLSQDRNSFEPEEEKEIFQELKRTTEDTYTMVTNLLDWVSVNMDTITLNFQPVALMKELLTNSKTHHHLAQEKDITFKIHGDKSAQALVDLNAIQIILHNLFSNAVKFSHRGGVIEGFTESDEDTVSLIIKDYGIGMSKEHISQLMSSELNVSTPGTMNEKGTGLGVNIIKEFVEKNHGKMKIESTKGSGTTIALSFPRYR